jgi:hypothetical protein
MILQLDIGTGVLIHFGSQMRLIMRVMRTMQMLSVVHLDFFHFQM